MLDLMVVAVVLSLIAAFLGVFIGAVALHTDRLQYAILRVIQQKTDIWEENGTFFEQADEYFTKREAPGKPTNLEIIADQVGSRLYASLRSGAAAVTSGDVRHNNMVESKTLEALEESDPEMKVLKGIFERLGLGDFWNPQDIPAVVNVLRKHNILGGAPIGGGAPSRGNDGMKIQ